MADNILTIVVNKKLREFILGVGEFLTERPNVDYSRWLEIKSYYHTLSSNNHQKTYIEDTILSMIKSRDPEERRIGIIIGRVINLPALSEIIRELISDANFEKLPLRTKDELCFSATLIQIKEVASVLVQYFYLQNRLREFIFCSQTPPYILEVKEDDIWRLEIIGQFYTASSSKDRSAILEIIKGSLIDSPNFRLAVHTYLERASECTSFVSDVAHVLSLISN